MEILLVSQYFYPESFKSNDVAFELAKRGHQVTVLTGIPNYPQGKFYEGYGLFKKRKEIINGVTVYRTFVIPRGNGGGVRLAFNYLSWAFIASLWAVFMALFKHYDAVFVHETSPVTQGIPALVVKWIRRSPLYFWVLDLWPESLQAAGGINNRQVLGFFAWLTRLIYRNSDKILISSKGFRKSILDKGDFGDKIVYFPNWAEDTFAKVGISAIDREKIKSLIPTGFRVMFAGNIGEAQDFDHVMQAALLLKEEKDIKFVIIGDGRKRQWVLDFIQANELQETVCCPGRFSLEMMPAFYREADVLFLALKDEPIFSLIVPAKVQTYMTAGKPIVAMINGETQDVIAEVNCGFSANASDYKTFAKHVMQLKRMTPEERHAMGEAALAYYENTYQKTVCMEHLFEIIEKRS